MRAIMKSAIFVAIFAATMTGTVQSQGTSAGASATFVFRKAYDRGLGFGSSTAQSYYHLPAGVCQGRRRLASFSWLSGAERERQLPAGAPVTLWMSTMRASGAWRSNCGKSVRFTPRPGATYDVALRAVVGSHCEASVVDRSTGQAPADLSFDDKLDCG
ncbi:MAG TPA: hypothetical protein VEC11_08035 [Allosphingosinicella sp.]|nr:hypothetical protein [Allosphingosinicella sp.]